MKVILEVKNKKVLCSKLKEYFKQVIQVLPNHRIVKIYGINETEEVLLMKSSHNHNTWFENEDWEFDKLDIIVIKKKHKTTQLETIEE
jgi:hypothetical protein